MNIDTEIFFKLPVVKNEFVLYPAKIAAVNDDIYTAEFENFKENALTFEPGQEIFICYEIKREFMQQAAQIDAVSRDDAELTVHFKTSGQPVSAERRQCYRVATVLLDLSAKVGSEENCPLIDVSATGFSIIAARPYDPGAILPVTLCYEDQLFTGQAAIQSVRELAPGKLRYGLHGITDTNADDNLEKGLHYINMSVQRMQLRRLSGAAAS